MPLPPSSPSDLACSRTLSVTDASGRQISVLNDQPGADSNPSLKTAAAAKITRRTHSTTLSCGISRRKYHCTEIGCNKSFTTRYHLFNNHRVS
ncbi:hypothetical protein BX666DRAFT_2001348 [Dichotomocladium elegans]|nr:hypothetical protein BX666DRAFT_2001348 [Dichotomocladium elegans]